MANNKFPFLIEKLSSSLSLLETIQTPRFRARGPSSSHMLNDLVRRLRKDISRTATDLSDVADQNRVMAQILGSQNSSIGRMISSLETKLTALGTTSPGVSGGRAVADFGVGAEIVSSSTSADINNRFLQASLPARTRQNALVIELPGGGTKVASDTQLLFCLKPDQTSTINVTPPADYEFGQDIRSVYALDGNELTAWIVEDPTTTPHMAWVDIVLPSNVSGAYRCNELELVTNPSFAASLVTLRAEIVGSGWKDLDFSYLTSYDASTKSVIGLGSSRLSFPEASITRFRLGLWVSGVFGFSSIRALRADYQSSAQITVDFSDYSPSGPIQTVQLHGKDPQALDLLPITVQGNVVTVTLSPTDASNTTPILNAIIAEW